MWNILRHYKVPRKFINIIKDLYNNSRCRVRTPEGATEFFEVLSGVKQGCILSTFLFLLVIDFAMNEVTNIAPFGIKWNNKDTLQDLDFADDLALIDTSITNLQLTTNALENIASSLGLKISTTKTKLMSIGEDAGSLKCNDEDLEIVDKFTYLGSCIDKFGLAESDVNIRIGKAGVVFKKLSKFWSSRALSTNTKVRLFNAVILPTALYSCENWRSTKGIEKRLDVFQQRCLRRILGISYRDHIRNTEVLECCQTKNWSNIVNDRRRKWLGHLLRTPAYQPCHRALTWYPAGGRRNRGRPKISLRSTLEKDLQCMGLGSMAEAATIARNRLDWRSLVAQYSGQSWRT